MIGLVRYLGSDLLRSQRFLLPMLLYVGLLAPLMSGEPGPPPQLWTFTALVLCPVSCWLAVTVANTEDPTQRQVTIAAAGGPARVAVGVLLTCLLADAVLIAIAICWPMLTTAHAFPGPAVLAGVLTHVAVAGFGTAAGLLCARPVLHGVGWSAVAGGATVLIAVTQNWLPPVGVAVRTLGEGPVATGTLALQAALGLALSAAATALTVVIHNCR